MDSLHFSKEDVQAVSFSYENRYSGNQLVVVSLYAGSEHSALAFDSYVKSNLTLFEIDMPFGQLIFTGMIMNNGFNVTIGGDAIIDLNIRPLYVEEKEFVA
jgi:hypothetical protein